MPFFMMDEMRLISMTEEEQKEYFKARKKFMERYCQYKHYRDKGNIDDIHQKYYNFPWPVAEKDKEMWERSLKNAHNSGLSVLVSPTDEVSEIVRKLEEQLGLDAKCFPFINSPYAIFTHHAKADGVNELITMLKDNIGEIAIQEEEFDLSQVKESKAIPVTKGESYRN